MNENIAVILARNFDFKIDMNSPSSYRDTFFDVLATVSNSSINEIRLDLIYVSNFVYAADRRVTRASAIDSWTRDFRLDIPVLLPEHWNNVKETLQEILAFLTGDNWQLDFHQRKLNEKEAELLENAQKSKVNKNPSHICMFSGGLDSFIGAIDILSSEDSSVPLFVSHYGGGSKGSKSYQDLLINNLLERFEHITEKSFLSFYSAAMKSLTGQDEPTTRSRSFMFFSHAIALTPDGGVLTIPENGFVSLNVPLYYSRNGSSSTRTTHPYYMRLFRELLSSLDINISMDNPYQFCTKGEMIKSCLDFTFLSDNIQNTMSCSHPEQGRWSGLSDPIHCGYCIPCSIRRASILASGINDPTTYRYKKYENRIGKETFNVLRISEHNFNEHNASTRVQYSGPLESNVAEYTRVFSEGMAEIQLLIDRVENDEIS